MAIARIRIEPAIEGSKKDRYLAKDINKINKKYKKIAIFGSVVMVASIILNIYQYLS